jgi:glycosyltransferase involved in cell wall biosynthesis
VASVLAQTRSDWELIVVDDGSTDGTRAFLEALGEPRIRTIHRAHCGNVPLLRNVGAREARGPYFALLDSDDVWLPEKLALQLAELRTRPECGWSYSNFVHIDERGRETGWLGRRRWVAYGGAILEHVVQVRALIATSTVVVKRDLFEAVGGFNETLLRCEDYDLWIRLAEASPAAVVATPLVKRREHPRDRVTKLLDVLGYMHRIYGDLAARSASPKVRRLCRLARARVSVYIVGRCRRAGRYGEARRALRTSFPHAGWHPGWWTELARISLASLQPR